MNTERAFPPSLALVLLYFSGLSALIYQVAWLRELRLVFGASTMASAAVLAIFMGGIGLGSIYLGRIAEHHRLPLKLYAYLEAGIALLAFASPLLIAFARVAYLALGGQAAMGNILSLLVRLALAACVLGLPTFLMGGTLPAMAKAVETDTDLGRRRTGRLYGVNTLGAVTGVVLATFWLLEALGTRATMWSGGLLNIAVAGAALYLARSLAPATAKKGKKKSPEPLNAPAAGEQSTQQGDRPRSILILTGAAVTGAIFLLMEIVWYRLLTPLLGGTTYSFGLILAGVLTGIGIGGWLYGRQEAEKIASIRLFAFTCALAAFCMAIPYALGDRLAVFAGLMRVFGNSGFLGHVLAWTIIIAIVVFPAAVVSGFQFPLIIGLLGQGRSRVALHTGTVYAANTGGAIAGSLAGGFGLIPLLGVLGCWKTAIALLAVSGVVLFAYSRKTESRSPISTLLLALVLATTFLMLNATGPTAAWRHSAIGAGRTDLSQKTRNGIREWLYAERNFLAWQTDGKESSVAMRTANGLSFIINGKADGNAYEDAPTQIMAPMIGALLHQAPRKALVIGLGTGSSGGWLASIDGIERVDVVELEPSIVEVARRSGPVNRNALANPKLKIIIGDGREYVQTSRSQYDIIFSEPSNPYRAGIASLYTREFYQSVSGRLAGDGIFSQWVQGYEVDSKTIRTIYATLCSVFPSVELWQSSSFDLLFICSHKKKNMNTAALRHKIGEQPYRDALLHGWGVTDLEGVLAHFIAPPVLAEYLFPAGPTRERINTDDRMYVEYGFARMVGNHKILQIHEMRRASRVFNVARPLVDQGEIDWNKVIDNYFLLYMQEGLAFLDEQPEGEEHQMRLLAYTAANDDNYDSNYIINAWGAQSREPEYPFELALVSEALADQGNMQSLKYIKALSGFWPAMADLVLARYYARTGNYDQAFQFFSQGFSRLHESPWGIKILVKRSMQLLAEMAVNQPEKAPELYRLMEKPFAVYMLEDFRQYTVMKIASLAGWQYGEQALMAIEPHIPWNEKLLAYRLECYKNTNNPLAKVAARDMETYRKNEPQPLF